MAQALELPAPMMRRTAGFEQDRGGGPLGEETQDPRAGQPMLFIDPARAVGHGHLKDRLGEINSDRRMLHLDSSWLWPARGRCVFGTMMPYQREESIPSTFG